VFRTDLGKALAMLRRESPGVDLPVRRRLD
jgi:hypothetical protein